MGDRVNGVHLTAGKVFDFQALRLRQSPNQPFKDEAETALFKDPVRTAQ